MQLWGEREAFTMEQLQALLRAAESDWIGCILFGFPTGLRPKDITNLKWENIELEERTYSVRTAKTKRVHKAGLHSDVEGWLGSRIRSLPYAFVFPDLACKRGGGRVALASNSSD